MYVHMSSIFSVNTEVYFRGIKFIVLTFKYWLEFSVYIWCFDRLIDWKKKVVGICRMWSLQQVLAWSDVVYL
jgi:hypothetical protein